MQDQISKYDVLFRCTFTAAWSSTEIAAGEVGQQGAVAVAELSQKLGVGLLATKSDLPTDDNAAFYGFLD
jgi:hypothetical protein